MHKADALLVPESERLQGRVEAAKPTRAASRAADDTAPGRLCWSHSVGALRSTCRELLARFRPGGPATAGLWSQQQEFEEV